MLVETKHCGRCRVVKQLSEFNKDKYTASGYRSQCKECMTKERTSLRDHYRRWRTTPERRKWYADYRRQRYEKDRLKIKARNAARALKQKPCENCGDERSQAHHDDYSRPLDVRWLCATCHVQWHVENDRHEQRLTGAKKA